MSILDSEWNWHTLSDYDFVVYLRECADLSAELSKSLIAEAAERIYLLLDRKDIVKMDEFKLDKDVEIYIWQTPEVLSTPQQVKITCKYEDKEWYAAYLKEHFDLHALGMMLRTLGDALLTNNE